MSPAAAPDAASPAPEATTAPVAPNPATQSTEAPAPAPSPHRPYSLGRALGLTGPDGRTPVSKLAESPQSEPAAQDDKSSAPAESKPSDQPGTPEGDQPDAPADPPQSRRERKEHENVARIRELEAEIASIKSATPAPEAEAPDLEARIAEALEKGRAEERDRIQRERTEAEQRTQQEALEAADRDWLERYTLLSGLPSDHPLLNEGDNWNWLDEQKRLVTQFPEAQKKIGALERARADQSLASERSVLYAELQGKQDAFWKALGEDMDTAAELPNVDMQALKGAATFVERNRLLHAAGAAWKEGEYAPKVAALEAEIAKRDEQISKLEDANHNLRLFGPRGLGSSRAPVDGGRSGTTEAGPPTFDPQRPARKNLAAALGFG